MSSRRSRQMVTLAWMGWLLLGTAARGGTLAGSAAWLDCEHRFAAHPDRFEGAKCMYDVQNAKGLAADAARRFRQLLVTYPRNPGLLLYLANLPPAPPDAEQYLRGAAGGFYSTGDPEGETVARANLAIRLLGAERLDEADAEIRRLAACAELVRGEARAKSLAKAAILRAKYLIQRGDFAAADKRLLAVPAAEQGDRNWLLLASTVHTETGDFDRGYKECRLLTETAHNDGERAGGLYCEARILLERRVELPEDNADRIKSIAAEAVRLAEPGKPGVAAKAHWLLAMLAAQGDPATARAELKRCLGVAPTDAERVPCESALARVEAAAGRSLPGWPDAAAAATVDPVLRSQYLGVQTRVSKATQPFSVFLGYAEKDLAEIEGLRSRQATSAARLGLFSTWSDDYSWFAGVLLKEASRGDCPTCLARAFAVGERVRARTLREALDAGAVRHSAAEPGAERLPALRQAMEAVRRRQGDATLPASERDFAGKDLAAFAAREKDLVRPPAAPAPREAAGGSGDDLAAKGGVEGDPLAAVQSLLHVDEAMLAFQIAPWTDWAGDFGGGAWVVVVTRGGARFYPLEHAGREELRREIDGLLANRQEPNPRRAATLRTMLFGGALADLPRGIRQLILVPDDHLSAVPFAALGTGEGKGGGGRLVDGYQVSIAPSATMWLDWRRAASPRTAARPAMVLADPTLPRPNVASALLAEGLKVPKEQLPAAHLEAEQVARFLGWRCDVRVGDAASKSAVEAAGFEPGPARRLRGGAPGDDADDAGGLRRFAVLHFAAHSIADPVDSRRSGIWLAPERGGDGFLREADIRALRLDGMLVVLSSCSSNRGQMVRGEGVMSLARAFFLARARTVVASLWPQGDTDAEALMVLFYKHLGAGESVASALAAAQRDRLRQDPGLRLESWAGFVVLGDGGLIPFPDGRQAWPAWLPPTPARLGAAAALVVAALLLLVMMALTARHFVLAVRRRRTAALS